MNRPSRLARRVSFIAIVSGYAQSILTAVSLGELTNPGARKVT